MGCYGIGAEYPKKWRKIVEEKINRQYYNFICINPVDYFEYGKNHHKSEREVMRFDLRMVKATDVVLVNLKDLNKSLGTSDEIIYAWNNDIPVIGFLEEGDIADVHPWKIEQIDRIETGKDAIQKAIEYIGFYYGK